MNKSEAQREEGSTEILTDREVGGTRQISGAISQTLTKSNNDQFISDHWSSTMAAYQPYTPSLHVTDWVPMVP